MYKKLKFLFNNITRLFSQSENEKITAKKYYQTNKEKLQETLEIFLKMKKLKREIMLTTEIKIWPMQLEKEKEEY